MNTLSPDLFFEFWSGVAFIGLVTSVCFYATALLTSYIIVCFGFVATAEEDPVPFHKDMVSHFSVEDTVIVCAWTLAPSRPRKISAGPHKCCPAGPGINSPHMNAMFV